MSASSDPDYSTSQSWTALPWTRGTWTPRTTEPDLARTSEYSIFGLAGNADQSVVRGRQISYTLVLFGVATLVAVLYSLERYFYSQLVNDPVPWRELVPAELIFTYAWALLTPMVVWSARQYPVWGQRRLRNWVIQLGAMGVFVIAHVAMFWFAATLFGRTSGSVSHFQLFGQYLLSWSVLDSIVFCCIVAVHNAVVYYRVSKDRLLRASQLEAHLAQSQLQMLRMQLQPHFLFNALNSISALMHKDVKRADSMIAALSDLLRMSLRNIGAQEVPLQGELDFLQRYIEIMSIRFGDRLQVHLDIDPETHHARVPNLFLQPLVENAFRHGFGDRAGQGHITVRIHRENEMLRCEVIDDGRGLQAGHKEGVGLASTRQRLAHLYGDQQTFSLRGSPGGGVHVTMSIPFHTYQSRAANS